MLVVEHLAVSVSVLPVQDQHHQHHHHHRTYHASSHLHFLLQQRDAAVTKLSKLPATPAAAAVAAFNGDSVPVAAHQSVLNATSSDQPARLAVSVPLSHAEVLRCSGVCPRPATRTPYVHAINPRPFLATSHTSIFVVFTSTFLFSHPPPSPRSRRLLPPSSPTLAPSLSFAVFRTCRGAPDHQQYAPTLLVSSAFPVSSHEKSRETHEGPLPTRSAVVSPSIGPFYETPRPPPTLVIAFLVR
ncbi:hypothetical protein CCHR01_04965 [Colletotrichum chrysophilum]|uniref:Uncharacterized protein n=1 Tax=Colletotrichum chrysophilum TaxID=1836956 RepID=A0AAD9EI31_9PEZI|nr:hypothetical protein CCHR01_04965 [Colletotrichum chrysophilum]